MYPNIDDTDFQVAIRLSPLILHQVVFHSKYCYSVTHFDRISRNDQIIQNRISIKINKHSQMSLNADQDY